MWHKKRNTLVGLLVLFPGRLRGAQVSTCDDSTARPSGGAGQVVLHVLRRLDALAELHHHYVGQRVAVLKTQPYFLTVLQREVKGERLRLGGT